MEMRPRLIVIGGGYVGSAVARRLDGDLDVTLIEPKQAFVHTPAMIRALVQPGLSEQALLPYDPLLRRGRVIRDRVTGIGSGGIGSGGGGSGGAADHVTLASGGRVQGDLILIATGSGHAGFLKPLGDSIADFRSLQSDTARRIAGARHIAIVGAGPVGIELAGEIAHACPDKAVTLLSAHPTLMPEFPAGLGRMLAAKLAALGVTLRHGRACLDERDHPSDGPLLLTDGQAIDADLILPATRARGHCALLEGLPGCACCRGPRCDRRLAAAFGPSAPVRRGRYRRDRRCHDHRRDHAPDPLSGENPALCREWRGFAPSPPLSPVARGLGQRADPAAARATPGGVLAALAGCAGAFRDHGRSVHPPDEGARPVRAKAAQGDGAGLSRPLRPSRG
ncbi:FAD-dependent oxidoreductase [Paracoccus sp. DMF-8]|uniref:FAD-dependent oxidoreductase n=1 Tax=Paracoccus sp. DMF-8 TaxID=3019445 RepID=UPI0023E7B1E4|nr:FAD-dependent oxidoreductase [Paracoccus sp. DMF-8]MDF3604909.1 FAD-dependent oxidoreductase [Paracoccus sp. DMF-8]